MSMLHELAHGESYSLPDPATDPSLPEKQTATLTGTRNNLATKYLHGTK